MVRRDLVDDPDAPSLLGEVQQDAFRGAPESLHRGVELLTTVTPLRPEDVPGHTLGVETDENIALPRHLTFHEGHVLFAREGAHERVDPEVSIAGREAGLASEKDVVAEFAFEARDRKSTRLNSSHRTISYAVFCLKKKTTTRASLGLVA